MKQLELFVEQECKTCEVKREHHHIGHQYEVIDMPLYGCGVCYNTIAYNGGK